MTSVNSEVPPVQNQIHLKTSNPTSDALDPDSAYEDEPLIMDPSHNPFSEELNNGTDNLPGMNVSNDDNANLEANTSGINRNLFSETPLGNGSNVTHDLEYLVSSTEENKEISSETSFDSPPLTPNRNGDILFESTDDDDETKTVAISCQPGESLGLVLGMNEIIDASEGEVRKVYVKKVSTNGAINRAMKESNSVRLGDEVLAINGTYIKTLGRTECLNLLTDLPTEITLLLLRNRLPWTSGPRCSFYLNLVDKNPESILSPAPKLFTNEGKKIPDGYKLLEVSLYREESDLLGISIVPSYSNTKHYYQIKELESEGICSKSKLLNKGDCLVSCNGNSLYKIPFNQCLNILKSEGPSLTFEVFRKDDNQAVLESHETQPVDDVSSEVNNNNNNNNNNSNNNNDDDDDGRSANSFTSELLISTEVKPTENTNPFLETSKQENLLDFSDTSHSDSKTSPDTSGSPDTSKSHLSSLECEVKNTLSQPLLDFLTGSPFIESKENISLDGLQKPINPAEPSLPSVVDEPCIELTSDPVEHSLKTGNPFIETTESVSLDGLQKPIDPAEPSLPSVVDEPCIQLTTEAVEHSLKTDLPNRSDIVSTGSSFIESTKSVSFEELQKPIETSLPSVVDEPSIKLTTEAVENTVKTNLSSQLDIVPTGNPFIESTESVSLDELQISIDPAEQSVPSVVDEPCVELTSDPVEHNLKTDLPSQLDIAPTGNPFKETTESVSLDGLHKSINPVELSEPCIELNTEAVEHSVKTNLSSQLDIVPTENPFIKSTESVSLDELQKTIIPVEPSLPSAIDEPSIQLTTEAVEHNLKTELPSEVDILPTGSSFIESTKSVSFEELQKPIELSLPSVVDEPCSQLTIEAVESSPHSDWSSELNMSKQSPAKDPFSLDGLEEFSNTVINDPNELNNNLRYVYPGSSNEDLISIDTDILSPINSNPTLIFSNHTDPWEAAGEAKSEHVVPDFQISPSTNPKNPLNEFIDIVESPDDGLDPLDGLQENIMQVDRDDKCLSPRPTNFGTDNTKGINLVPSGNVSLDSDLVEEERTSPISYDDSLSGSTGIQTADEEGDIPLSSRNSDNDLIDEMPALSPDSGRADSPGVYKNSSYYQDKFNQKEIISKLPTPGISDDHDKLTDDEATIYHTISDTSRKNKSSEKHGSFDSCDSCGTSVGSFESCAETGELDPFSTNSKQMTNRNKDLNLTRSLPRNAFSNFQEYKTGTFKLPSDARFNTSNGKRDLNDLNKTEYLNKFSTNIFGHYKRERDQVRSEDKPFQVEVLKGIIGLGMTLKVDDQGFMKVTHIQNNSPIGRNGIIKVGDYILSINNTDIVGESYSRVQQILRLLPRGLIKVVASAVPMSDWKKYTEESPLNLSASLKMTKSPEFSSPVESPLRQQVRNQLETKVKVPETKTEYLVTNSFDNKVEKPSSPVSVRKSPISWTEHQQIEHQIPFTMKSSLTFSPTIKAQQLSDAPDNTSSLSASRLKNETPSFFKDPVSSTSPSRDEETRQNPLPAKVTDLPEVKLEISIPSSPLKTKVLNTDVIDGLSMSTMTSSHRSLSPVSSPKRPLSPVSSPHKPLSPVSSPHNPLSPVASPKRPLSPVSSPYRPLSPVSSPYRPLSAVSSSQKPFSPVASPKNPPSPVSSPKRPLSPVSSPKRPLSPMTKPPEYKTETLTLSSPFKIVSSSPVVSKVSEISPVLASPVRPVSLFKDMTETQASSPSASPSTFHLETTHNDSAPASPNSVSPRRFGSTNRKLPDIFQGSHISVSSPIKFKSLSGASSPSESFSIENTVSEQKAHKIKEVPNAEVALSRSISVEPKIASELRDSKLKSHGVEIIQSPQAEIAVSHPINIEPIKASTLTEVTAEKPGVQVREEVSKREVAVSQFIGIKPTTATDLSEKKVTTPTTSVVEEIAKPKVAVSQFIGIKPTAVSDLSSVKELKKNTVELSKPDKEPTPSVKKQEQNIEIFAGIPSPKSEVAVSKFIGVKPTTATKLSESVKSSPVSDAPKSPEKQSPSSRTKLASSSRAHSVTSPDYGQRSLPRSISMQYVSPVARNSKSGNEEKLSSSQGEKIGIIRSRRVERPRPKSEVASIFSKRKWCISTKFGQTNFAVPSQPETVDSVIQLGIIDEDDLSRLLTSANMALDKMLFSNNEEIHIAILEKEPSEKIGIKLKKGEKQELVISLLEPDGAAIKQKSIYIGDSLLLVNGKPAWNQTVMDVKVMLQTIEMRIILVLCRHPMDDEEAANDCEYLDVILRKGVTGVGFCLEGGVGCPLGDRPISVKRIFKGGPAEKGGQLMVGDEILKVNDTDFQKQRHFVAWNHLKFLPEGDVKLHICRRKSQAESTKAAKLQAVDDDSTVNTSA